MAAQMPATGAVKVKRDGPRGWHWIAASSFDPARHELVDALAPAAVPAPKPAPAAVPAPPARRGRPPKNPELNKGA